MILLAYKRKSSYCEKVLKQIQEAFPGMELKLEVPMYEEGKTPRIARKYKVDIFIPLLKVAIEVDGEHHFKPIAYDSDQVKAQSKFERRRMLDTRKNYYATLLGWRMIRLTPEDVKNGVIVDKLKAILEEALS